MSDKSAGGWFTWGSRLPQSPGRRAAAILVFSYVLGFVLPVTGAVMSLAVAQHGAHAAARTDSIVAELVNDAIPLVLSLLAATLGMRTAARAPLAMRGTDLGLRRSAALNRGRAAGTTLMYLATLTAASIATDLLLALLGVQADSPTAPTQRLPAAIIDNAWAGLLEEPILLGLTVGLAVRVRWRWWAVLPLMIVLRGAFHVYYGPGVLFVIPWMCGAYLLYRRCPLLWPFVLAHGAYDALVSLTDNAPHAAALTASVIQDTLAILGTLIAVRAVWTHLRTHGLGRGEPEPAGAPA
jgi:Type II CAAX prenyl endopeptidase Rce1-like